MVQLQQRVTLSSANLTYTQEVLIITSVENIYKHLPRTGVWVNTVQGFTSRACSQFAKVLLQKSVQALYVKVRHSHQANRQDMLWQSSELLPHFGALHFSSDPQSLKGSNYTEAFADTAQ